jgi:hydroxyacylglutathione hydrolase
MAMSISLTCGGKKWDEGHIPQASYSFLGKLLQNVGNLTNDKPIVFQCRSGARSAIACSIAQAKGIKNVINLDGGIVQWAMEGYPIATDQPQPIGCGVGRKAC